MIDRDMGAYAGAELGIAASRGFAAASASRSFARVHPDVTGRIGVRLTAYLGARLMVLGLDTAMLMVGFGRF